MRLPYWADGGIFGLLLAPLVFFLKLFCPLNSGCFADPFLVAIFSPLFILEGVADGRLSARFEITFIVLFWAIAWALLAHLYGKITNSKSGGMLKTRGEKEI